MFTSVHDYSEDIEESAIQSEKISKDEMLVLPETLRKSKMTNKQDSGIFGQFGESYPTMDRNIQNTTAPDYVISSSILPDPTDAGKKVPYQFTTESHITKVTDPRESAGSVDAIEIEQLPVSRPRVTVKDKDNQTIQSESHRPAYVSSVHGVPHGRKSIQKDTRTLAEKLHIDEDRLRTKEMERKIIERELQRQRTITASVHKKKTVPGLQTHTVHA
jgi:hypothetical protein